MYGKTIKLPAGDFYLEGLLTIPVQVKSLIIFLSGYGNQEDLRNYFLANRLNEAGYGTLIFDPLNKREYDSPKKLNIDLLTRRVITNTTWVSNHSEYRMLNLGYLGIDTGAAPALIAASKLGAKIRTIVTVGGRTDLAHEALSKIGSPTMMIAPEYDFHAIKINKRAQKLLNAPNKLAVIPGASHFYEERVKTEEVATMAISWFQKYLPTVNKSRSNLIINNG